MPYNRDTQLSLALSRFARHRGAVVSIIILSVMSIAALGAPLLSRSDPEKINLREIHQPPSTAHILGTDKLGYDVFSRLIWGARVSLMVGFGSVFISVFIGLLLGVLAGYYGGWIDGTVLHITNALLSLPSLLLVAIFVSIIGPSLKSVIVVISLLSWPSISRLVRGQILAVRETEFIVAARVIGASDWQIIFRHLLPNILGSVAVAATFFMAQAILLEAALSFLGLGVRPPAPSWGNMVNLATNVNVLQHMPWVWFPPATSIALVVLAHFFLGTVYETLLTHVPQDQVEPRMLVILTHRVLALIDYGLFDVD